jgi:hypothetical protein
MIGGDAVGGDVDWGLARALAVGRMSLELLPALTSTGPGSMTVIWRSSSSARCIGPAEASVVMDAMADSFRGCLRRPKAS